MTHRQCYLQNTAEIFQTLLVPVESFATDSLLGIERYIREAAELLTGGDVGKMNLRSGQCHSLQCIEYCHACVGVCSRVDEYTVEYTVCSLNLVHDSTLMVRLEQLHLKRKFCGSRDNERLKRLEVFRSVKIRLAQPQKIEVRTIDYKYLFHI